MTDTKWHGNNRVMIVFIDESGIHKQVGHATTAVVYVEVENMQKFEKAILKIEKELKIDSFHWAEERWVVRSKFLEMISDLDFKVKVAVFKNPVHKAKLIEVIFQHLIIETDIRSIFIDGKKPKWYELRLKKVLRDKGISVKKLRTVRDEASLGIQVADCVAGLVRRYYDNPDEQLPAKWFNKLRSNKKLFVQLLFEFDK